MIYSRTPVESIQYGVTVNSAEPVSSPSTQTLQSELGAIGAQLTAGEVHRVHKLYIKGSRTSQNLTAVSESLRSAWTQENSGEKNVELRFSKLRIIELFYMYF